MRKLGVLTAACVLAATTLGVVTSSTATATTPPVAMTADAVSTYQTNGIVWAFAEANGVVFAGGTFSSLRPSGSAPGTDEQPAANFAAFDAATGEPTGCELSFTVGSGDATVRALAVSPDKKTLYAGGFFGAVNGVPVSSLAAIDIASCTPIASFHPSVNATVRAIAASDYTVYFGGDLTSVAGESRGHFAAVGTDGALTSWAPDADETGRAVELAPDGQHAIIGGDFFTVNGAGTHALAVVDRSGGAVTKAYPGFIQQTSVVKDITTDATGFYTANEGTGGGVFDGRIALNYSDWNQRWRDTCLGATQGVAVYKGVLYSASHAHDCSSMGEFPNSTRKHLLAESVDDPHLLGWFPDTNDGIGESVGPRVMITSSSGGADYMWVGGGFTTANGRPQQGLTRFANGPDTGAPSVPQVHVSSTKPGAVTVSWQSSLDLDDSNLTYRVYRNGSTTPVYTVSGSSLPWDRPQLTFTDTDVTAGSSYSYRVTASDGTNTSAKSADRSAVAATVPEAYAQQVIADGPLLYWRFDETSGSYAADLSGHDNSGVHVGGPAKGLTPGALPRTGTAAGYNGSTQWTYSDRQFPHPATFSMETWFRTTTTDGGRIIGFGSHTTQPSYAWDKQVYMANGGQLEFGVWSGGVRAIGTPGSYNDGAWHHVVATQGSGGMRLYVDGSLKASNISVTGNQDYPGYWRVGGDNIGNWPLRPSSNYFAGQIDETAVYPGVLSAGQVSQHYTLGKSG